MYRSKDDHVTLRIRLEEKVASTQTLTETYLITDAPITFDLLTSVTKQND